MAKNRKTKLSIVTPCFNAERYIVETMRSVLGNRAVVTGEVELQYIVVDGGSTDATVDLIEQERAERGRNVHLELISEADNGVYDAVGKGFRRGDGDIFAYLNAGDFYSPTAFEIVGEIIGGNGIDWVTGFTTIYNERSDIIEVKLPYKYRSRLFEVGLYGPFLPCVEQESTFWSAKLHAGIDIERFSQFKLAGDFYLWKTFAAHAGLEIVQAWLGGFKVHSGQLSEQIERYMAELKSISGRPRIDDYLVAALDRVLWFLPNEAKKLLNQEIFSFEPGSGRYLPARRTRREKRRRAVERRAREKAR